MTLAYWSGWIAALVLAAAGAMPLVVWWRLGSRGGLRARTTRAHIALGLSTVACAFLHTLLVIPSLGSPAAVGSGPLAIAPAGLAFFLLVAHAGLGLQLRGERCRGRERVKIRRTHSLTAIAIVLAVSVHVATLEWARP